MPPVRWKTLYVTTALFQTLVLVSSNSMQEPLTMTSDGWRPIVGSRRQPPGFETDMRVFHYKNPSQNVEIESFKSENPITITSTAEPDQEDTEIATKPLNSLNTGPGQAQGSKVAPHSKFSTTKYQTLPPSAVSLGRPSQYGFRKHPLPAKPVKQMTHVPPPKRKPPPRGPVTAHSTRNEVFIHPPSMNFPYIKQGPSNVRTRETQGLGLFGSQNHFTVNQPNSHVEINRFPSLNENVFEQFKSAGISFLVPKIKNGQQDEYSRNLVPPPPSRNLAEKEKLKNSKIPKFKDNVAQVSEPVLEIHDSFGVKDNLVQIPVNYDQHFVLQKPLKTKYPPVDVQVTKENLKVFHNILPNRFKASGPDYVDYDYHNVPTPGQLPKLQTYEVTEGKWQESPNPYTFSYLNTQKPPQTPQIVRQQPIGPQITNEPIVELNLPPFLPTPFRPDPAYPTSPTQSEASTVFSQVSKKMNKFKNAALNNNPLFFDIKEVSTHYPILGRPAFVQEEQTENPVKENEIVNEVTTTREESTTKKRRRRPQPRRPTTSSPTTTTTTTTTEEPQRTEIYAPVRTHEEISPETERTPPKRIRQRPNRYRVPSNGAAISQENQDGAILYRTTTPSSENEENTGEKRVRGRNRYRQRGSGNKDPTELRNSLYRKRTRPTTTTTEIPLNHKMVETENSQQAENDGYESKYFQNSGIETTTRQRIIDYEENSMSEEDKSEIVYESTPSANYIEDVIVKGIRTTTPFEEITLVNIKNPENEINFTTQRPQPQIDIEQIIETTQFTTIPTTTTTEVRTTTKPSRIKSRPVNFKTSNRPRFSVKDYRQRLNQYSSSTAPSTITTDIVRTTSEGSRLRFPVRLRTRPIYSSSTTATPPPEETTTELIVRRRFKPKDPRHSQTTESPNIIPETNVKSVNTRLRPFDRYKSSTEATTKTKVSIKPNIYLNRRRPPITMRNKLNEKENKTEEAPTREPEEEKLDEDKDDAELTTEYQSVKISTTDIPPITTLDVNEDDYSQRVSDLTSSFKSQYETPGLFKNVAPVSRRVPNYFTISTEDPILPIEAFFPGINEKDKET